jgi:hypothetical protein
MDLDAEYKDFFEGLGDHGTAFYKFFDLFRINLGDSKEEGMSRGIHYGKQASDNSLSDEQLRALKAYLKTQRTWIRKEQKNADRAECRRRLWFWCQKLLDFGAFDRPIRRDISMWMDFALERTMEGVQVRVESYQGNFVMAKDFTAPASQGSNSQA